MKMLGCDSNEVDLNKGESVGALLSTINQNCAKYFSSTNFQKDKSEFSASLQKDVQDSLDSPLDSRVILIEKKNGSYGFTLQSYGVRYKHGQRQTDFITYVNAVEKQGAAFEAGLREGDVILSINGQNMARVEHKSLVNFIRKCPTHLKMVVVSDERARKVELHMKYVHLQKKLHDKMKELEQLNWKEKEILAGAYRKEKTCSPDAPCLSSSTTSACCFCPQTQKNKHLEDQEKSKTISTTLGTGTSRIEKNIEKEVLYYDCYRKLSQSNKELSRKDSIKRASNSNNNSTNNKNTVMGANSKTGINSSSISGSSSTVPYQNPTGKPPNIRNSSTSLLATTIVGKIGNNNNKDLPTSSYSTENKNNKNNIGSTSKPQQSSSSAVCDSQLKPKSWDNLMTTTSVGASGGYGWWNGYYARDFHHHHHLNHHSFCKHSHSNNYYHNKQQTSSANTVRQSSHHYGQCLASVTNSGNSKTLPSMRNSSVTGCNNPPVPDPFLKIEKTLSDSSLNSEHHKTFVKSMSHYNREESSDDDEYDQYRTEGNIKGATTKKNEKGHDIFV